MLAPHTPLAGPQNPLAGPQTPLAGLQTPYDDSQTPMDRWMDGQIDRQINSISFHSTELCPLLGVLPCYPQRLHKNARHGNC